MHVQSGCFDCHSLDVAVVVAFLKAPYLAKSATQPFLESSRNAPPHCGRTT